MATDVVFTECGRCLTARINAEIDHHSARKIREAIDTRLFFSHPEQLVIDFSGVGFMDSSGIALILGRAEVAAALSCSVRLVGLSRGLMKLVRLSGIERVRNITVREYSEQ